MADDQQQGEKTEEATPKKREDAREKGQVAMSNEFVVAMGLLMGVGAMYMAGPSLLGASESVVRSSIREIGQGGLQDGELAFFVKALRDASQTVLVPFLALVLPVYVLSLMIGYGQVGFRLTPKAVEIDWNKLNPVKGAQKMFGARGWVRTGLASLKVVLIMTSVVAAIYVQRGSVVALTGLDLTTALSATMRILALAALAGVIAAILLAVVDLVFQRFQHSKDLRMTKKEVRDETKNTEGDPQVRARIRNVQREMSRRRMMADVPHATVVITNPTHFAVALKYEEGNSDRAPYVVAKGLDEVAQNIKRVAREAGVPIVEDKPLARGLHRMVEIGDEIPEELFEAVAKVLAFVLQPERARANAEHALQGAGQ